VIEANRLPWGLREGADEIIADRSRAFMKLRFFETAADHQRRSTTFGSEHEMLRIPQRTPGRIAQRRSVCTRTSVSNFRSALFPVG
jgi:hypothetical protein